VQTYGGGEAAVQLPIGLALGVEYNASYDVVDYKEFAASLLNVYLYTGFSPGQASSPRASSANTTLRLPAGASRRARAARRPPDARGDVSGVALREYEDLTGGSASFARLLLLANALRSRPGAGDTCASWSTDRTQRASLDLKPALRLEFSGEHTLPCVQRLVRAGGGRDRHLDPTAVLKISIS